MKNIFRIFKNDVSRIRSNVIAMIVIMGITVIPTLYAWFNIAASWDPYGNTGNLKIAVASLDEGYDSELINVNLNLGDQILDTLKENDNFNWVFTEADDASSGVKSGKYFAALVIPEDFSRNLMSIFSKDVVHPTITYYENEKSNAIAPIVTTKGANAVQQQVNETFLDTISKTALEALQLVNTASKEAGDESIIDNLASSLSQISTNLGNAADTVQSFSDMTQAGALMLDTTTEFLQQSGSGTKNSIAAIDKAGDGIDSLNSALSGTTSTISDALAQNAEFYTAVSDAVGKALNSYTDDAAASAKALYTVSDRVQRIIDKYTEIENSLTAIGDEFPDLTILNSAIKDINNLIDTAIDRQTAIKNKIEDAASKVTDATADASTLKKEIDDLISQTTSSVSAVKNTYEKNVKSNLDDLADSLTNTGDSVSSLLTQLNSSVKDISKVTDSASSDLTDVQNVLDDSVKLLNEASDKLSTVSKRITEEGSLDALTDLLQESPEDMAAFIASPVKLHENQIYPIENYGSAMAPFYSTLAIWVGAVVMAAMLKVNVSESTKEKLFHPMEHQLYLGRMILLICIGILQSALICLGDLYFLGIQCEHPFLFVVTGCFSSLVYVNIIYALTVSFGDIGKAVAVVLMVMQVAGSGGTFPIECAPKFFQAVYPMLPFVHSMNAMRECIAGFYDNYYMVEMGKMALYLVPSLLLGLLLRKPIIKLNNAFIEKLESTKLI